MTLPNKPSPVGELTTTTDSDRAIQAALMQGDLSKLDPDQKYSHYLAVCKSLDLNPLTKPFAYIRLPNGKEILYALRDATDQLRKKHNVSVTDLTTIERGDIYIVIAKVRMGERTDAGTGAVSLAGLRGENLANALMKAETKSKRRATLSICGLGFLDETEAEDIPNARVNPITPGTPEEIQDHIPERNDPDRIPDDVTFGTRELPRMQQHAVYKKLQEELRAFTSGEDLQEWKSLPETASRVAMLRPDWRETFRGQVKERILEFRGKEKMQSRTHTQLLETKWLGDLERSYKTAEDMADFFTVDVELFNGRVDDVTQEARNEAHKIRQARLDQLTVVAEEK